ncbi:MAG: phosphoribosylglycinamide formyltransferase [Candidatus Omnitrophica bacterium]|nr:phosphoribosylglycinamide formyltransferase [Candidatus Omnitrophota bacterium]
MTRLAVLCSGNGTNLQAIINHIKKGYIRARISLVISDRRDAFALKRASKAGINAVYLNPSRFKNKQAYDREIIARLKRENVKLIVLAGYMRMLSPYFVRQFKNRILNIHPALLPSFKGTEGIKDAWEYGVKVTGPTVHFVDEGMDSGPIILQEPVRVRDDDTEDALARRIHMAEHRIYPLAIKLFLSGRLKIAGRKVILRRLK